MINIFWLDVKFSILFCGKIGKLMWIISQYQSYIINGPEKFSNTTPIALASFDYQNIAKTTVPKLFPISQSILNSLLYLPNSPPVYKWS